MTGMWMLTSVSTISVFASSLCGMSCRTGTEDVVLESSGNVQSSQYIGLLYYRDASLCTEGMHISIQLY